MIRTRRGANPGSTAPGANRAENDPGAALAGYIADITAELAQLASRSDLPMLVYFLNLARAEAELRSREATTLAAVPRRSTRA